MLSPLSRLDTEACYATKVILPQECFCLHLKTRPCVCFILPRAAAEGCCVEKRDINLNGALVCHMLIQHVLTDSKVMAVSTKSTDVTPAVVESN